MNKYIKTIAIAILTIGGNNALAQNLSLEQQRQFNLKALELIQDYELNSTMSNAEAAGEFLYLFDNESVQIYNDLLGFSTKKKLSVAEYISLFREKSKTPNIMLKDLRKGDIYSDNQNWLLDITFDKEIFYTDACGTLLSSAEYYGTDHKMKATIAMDKETGRTFIKALEGGIDSKVAPLPEKYAVIKNDGSEYIKDVLCNGERLSFNKFNQALVPSNPVFLFSDSDVNMKVNREQSSSCEAYSLSFTPVHWRIKVYGEMSIGDFYKISNLPNGLNAKSSATSFGLDVGYVFPSKSKVKFGVFLGAAYSMSKLDLTMDKLNYSYAASQNADMDNDNYNRYYELSNISQSMKINNIVIPVYLDLDYRTSKRFSVYVQAGIKNYLQMNATTDFNADAYAYGIYPKYSNLRLDETWLNEFGNKHLTTSNLESDKVEVKSFSLDGFAGLGFRVKLVGSLLLDAGVNYQMGLMKVAEAPATSVLFSNPREENALVNYTVAGGEHARTLIEGVDNIKRQGLNVKFGLMFKF